MSPSIDDIFIDALLNKVKDLTHNEQDLITEYHHSDSSLARHEVLKNTARYQIFYTVQKAKQSAVTREGYSIYLCASHSQTAWCVRVAHRHP